MSRVVWYFEEKGETHGPLAWDGLQAAVQEGRLTKQGSVWSPGAEDWVSSAVVPWLIYPAASPITMSESRSGESQSASGLADSLHLVTSPPPVKSARGWRWSWPSARSPLVRFGLKLAPLRARVAAAVIDLLFASLIGVAVAAFAFRILEEQKSTISASRDSVIGGVWLVCVVLYHVTLESLTGTTFGNRFLHCRLVDARGDSPFATRIVVRVLLRFFVALWAGGTVNDWLTSAVKLSFSLGLMDPVLHVGVVLSLTALLLPLFIGEHRPLHDVISGCWLVRTKDRKPPEPPLVRSSGLSAEAGAQ